MRPGTPDIGDPSSRRRPSSLRTSQLQICPNRTGFSPNLGRFAPQISFPDFGCPETRGFACVHELVLIDTLGIHLVDATRAARCSSTRGCGQPTCCGSFQTAQSFTSGRSRHRWGQPNNPPHGKVDSTRQNKHRWTAEIASREKCRRGSMMAGSGSWRACGIA